MTEEEVKMQDDTPVEEQPAVSDNVSNAVSDNADNTETTEGQEETEEISEEQDEKMPFPTARVVRIIRANIAKDKMIKSDVKIGMNKFLGNIAVDISVGSIQFIFTEGAYLATNNTIDLDVGVGSIEVVMGLPSDIGGSFTGSIDTGDIDIVSFGWTEVTETHYETTNFLTASDLVTMNAEIGTGSILAVLQQ